MIFTAKKDGKIIAINETGEFPLMNYDYIEEDTEHQISDYVHCDGQFVLTNPNEATKQYKEQVRSIRNQYLEQTDKFMLADYPITDEERALYKQYRAYLRDYPEISETWYEVNPKSFDEWKLDT